MKRLALIFALLLCTLPLSGCAILFEEPSALILPPASDQEEYVERTLINSFLNDGAHLQVPEDMEDPAAIIDLDIDGDKQDEKLAFWSNNNGHEVGVMLMHQNDEGTWSILDQIQQYGNGIDFFRLFDIDGDGSDEACVGVDVGGNNVLSIYHMNSDGFTEMTQINYSFLEMADLNGDGNEAILCALNNYEDTAPTTTLTVYEGGEDVTSVYEKSFDGNCLEMAFGNVSDSQRGLYFVHSNNYSDLNVELLLPTEDNSFEEQMTSRVHFVNRVATRDPIIAVSPATACWCASGFSSRSKRSAAKRATICASGKPGTATAPWKISTVCSKTAPMATPLCCRSIVWIQCAISL